MPNLFETLHAEFWWHCVAYGPMCTYILEVPLPTSINLLIIWEHCRTPLNAHSRIIHMIIFLGGCRGIHCQECRWNSWYHFLNSSSLRRPELASSCGECNHKVSEWGSVCEGFCWSFSANNRTNAQSVQQCCAFETAEVVLSAHWPDSYPAFCKVCFQQACFLARLPYFLSLSRICSAKTSNGTCLHSIFA